MLLNVLKKVKKCLKVHFEQQKCICYCYLSTTFDYIDREKSFKDETSMKQEADSKFKEVEDQFLEKNTKLLNDLKQIESQQR